MTDLQLRIGAEEKTSADLVINDIITGQVNVNESALSDFSTTIPKYPEVRQYLQERIYLADDGANEILWWGTLETWDESETGVQTNISARGPLLDEAQSVASEIYTDTFADDALTTQIGKASTKFEIIYQDRDNRAKDVTPLNDGGGNTDTVENQLVTSSSEQFTDWEVYVKYSDAITTSTVGVSDTSGGADETTTITGDATKNYAHGELTCANPTSEPYTYISTPSSGVTIDHIIVFPSDSTQAYIFNEEVDGTILEGIQTLSEIAGYRFSPQNFDALTSDIDSHIAFPIGYELGSPDFRILEASRASDFAGYANEITVKGEGNFTVTVTDDEEVNTVGRTISRFERRPDAKNTAQARSIARNTLGEAIQNRGESGSLTTTIPVEKADTIVGASRVIPVWSDSFKDGGAEGSNYLSFNEQNAVPRVEGKNIPADSSERITLLVFAELNEFDTGRRYLLSSDDDTHLLTLNPDGSLRFEQGDGDIVKETAPNVIKNETTHTVKLSIDDGSNGTVDIFVDGSQVLSFDGTVSVNIDTLYLGNKRRVNGDVDPSRVPSGQVAHVTFDKVTYNTNPDEYDNISPNENDVFQLATSSDTEGTEYTILNPENAEYREGIEFANTDGLVASDSNKYDLGTGNFSLAFSFKVPSFGGSVERPIWEKGSAYSTNIGYSVSLDAGGDTLELAISDGSELSTYTLADVSKGDYDEGEWVHAVINIDRAGAVRTYINGSRVSTYDITKWENVDISNSQDVLVGGNGGNGVLFHLDELRAYTRVLTTNEIEEISSLTGNYRDDFLGGIDNFRYGSDSSTTVSNDIQWRFNDDSTPSTAIDSIGTNDGTIIGAEYGATLAPPREITYNLIDGATADISFDISGRVDTELSDVRRNVRNSKK